MKHFTNMVTMVCLLFSMHTGIVQASELNTTNAQEKISVIIRDLKIFHQHEWRNLNLNIEYQVDAHHDRIRVQSINTHINQMLKDYAEPDDFWEIMNTKLVHSLQQNFPELTTIRSTLSLSPDQALHFPRESIVVYNRDTNTIKESFDYTKLHYQICQETFRSLNLRVKWDMKSNPARFDYPDYQWVDAAMDDFFAEHPVRLSKWQDLAPKLEQYLLKKFPTTTSMQVIVTLAE